MYIYVQVPFKSSPTFPRLKVGEIVRLLSPYGTRHGAIPCTEESFETSDTRYGDRDARRRLVARRFSLPMHARFLVLYLDRLSAYGVHYSTCTGTHKIEYERTHVHEASPSKRKSTDTSELHLAILCDVRSNGGSRTNVRSSFKK